jgi:hypothetical protein
VPSYWIAHPAETAFISALTPEGIGQLLRMAEGWPIGRYRRFWKYGSTMLMS